MRRSLEHTLGADYVPNGIVNININVSNLLNNLVTKTEADMNNYASSTATDFMEAYYKVALKRFVHDFSVLAVETCLVEQLPTLFTPVDVLDMDKAVVESLASESEDSSTQRSRLKEKLQVLENGLQALQGVQEYAAGRTGTFGKFHLI
ncbi:hypothetical protein J1614_003266 [Plenodomus biglobosus]|nr:hypothetical protein J1614_003266 [Plenodomus biglobosus]